MSSRTLALVVAVALLIAGGALYLVLGGGGAQATGGRAPTDTAAADPGAAPAAPGPAPAAQGPAPRADRGPRLRRLADLAERARVMASIAHARAQRLSGATTIPAMPSLPLGTMSKDDIKDAVHEIAPLLAQCYDQALARGPVPHQTIIRAHVEVTGEPDVGSMIESAELSSDDGGLADPAFAECLHETLMSVELPALDEGGVITFTYPFVFRSDDDGGGDARLTPAPHGP
jgi:pyruvate/2-oxoglutarate dehydrogenase complex dihydrolipoamide acyltransferase (E2) component